MFKAILSLALMLLPCLSSLPACAGETAGGHVYANGAPVENAEVRWIKSLQKKETARSMFNDCGQYETVATTHTGAQGAFNFPVEQLDEWYQFSVL